MYMERIKSMINAEKIVSIFSYLILIVLCLMLAINVFHYSFISFDGGWNAQVAANYAETGQYATMWPAGAVFNRVITTGQTMLIPTAWIFKLFGISFETIAAVPLCYLIAFIVMLFILIRGNIVEMLQKYYDNEERISMQVNLISLLVLIAIWSVLRLSAYSFDLCGEGATMFFITAGLIGINKYKDKSSCWWLVLTGAAFIGAIITKLVSICFIAVATVVLMVYIAQRNKVKDICVLIGGMLVSFIALDFVKFQQLGYSISNYVNWWIEYFIYNLELNQASNNMSLVEKMFCYENSFQLQRYWGILALGLGIGISIYVGVQGVFKKKWHIPIEVFICGLGGVSYILVSIFISKGGALWTRRLIIHFAFFLLYLILITVHFFLYLKNQIVDYSKKNQIRIKTVFVNLMGVLIICISIAPAFLPGVTGLVSLNTARRQEQQILWDQVAQFPEEYKLVTFDWRFASAISTLNRMDIVHINEVDFESGEKYYYISDDYLVQEILDTFDYNILYQKNADSLQPCIVELTGWKSSVE